MVAELLHGRGVGGIRLGLSDAAHAAATEKRAKHEELAGVVNNT